MSTGDFYFLYSLVQSIQGEKKRGIIKSGGDKKAEETARIGSRAQSDKRQQQAISNHLSALLDFILLSRYLFECIGQISRQTRRVFFFFSMLL